MCTIVPRDIFIGSSRKILIVISQNQRRWHFVIVVLDRLVRRNTSIDPIPSIFRSLKLLHFLFQRKRSFIIEVLPFSILW